MKQQINPYKVFNVPDNTSLEDIKKVYKKLVRQYHPDLNPGISDNKIKEINNAWDILNKGSYNPNFNYTSSSNTSSKKTSYRRTSRRMNRTQVRIIFKFKDFILLKKGGYRLEATYREKFDDKLKTKRFKEGDTLSVENGKFIIKIISLRCDEMVINYNGKEYRIDPNEQKEIKAKYRFSLKLRSHRF